jgi:hypothetical protein
LILFEAWDLLEKTALGAFETSEVSAEMMKVSFVQVQDLFLILI